MNKLAVVHFLPLEFYPPVTNALDVFSNQKELEIRAFSTVNNKGRKHYANNRVNVFRTSFPDLRSFVLVRLMSYLSFNILTLLRLIVFHPQKIMYYESYSVWPVYIYHKYFCWRKKPELFIHYHEYSSLDWYKTTMRLVKFYYQLEKKYLWKKTQWISHTNKKRGELFYKDHPSIDRNLIKSMPNHPPASWALKQKREASTPEVIRMVYVGSLSFQDTYIQELCEWVKSRSGRVTLDIYSYNLYPDVQDYLSNLDQDIFSFYSKGVDYQNIPSVLSKYDIGVILYKGNTLNYVYNAPNKLFEYLVCGLQVWYPSEMVGITNHKEELGQSIIEIEFSSIQKTSLDIEVRNLLNFNFTTEESMKELVQEIVK